MGVCDGVVCAIGMDDRHLRRFWRGPVALPLWIRAFPGMTVVLQRGGAPFVLRTFPPHSGGNPAQPRTSPAVASLARPLCPSDISPASGGNHAPWPPRSP